MIKTLSIDALAPGMMVTSVVEQNGPVKIRKVGIIRSAEMIKGLKEMGVKIVEVDFSQSLETDSTGQELTEATETKSSLAKNQADTHSSATQKLITSRHYQSANERNAPQQQHRSLFVPAMEETKLKWGIYSNPYITLCLLVLIGSLVGWGGSFAFFEYSVYRESISAQSSSNLNQSSDVNRTDPTSSLSENSLVGSKGQSNKDGLDSKDAPNSSEQQNKEMTVANNDSKESGSNSNEPKQAMSINEESTPRVSEDPETGLKLEDGQVVLGYKPGQDAEDVPLNSSITNNPVFNENTQSPEDSDMPINQDLLKRIKNATEEVDSRLPNEFDNILSVTDLTALPRIDQLPQNLLSQIPRMSFSAHMYASNPQDRWVRVNSRRVGEGNFISNNLILKKIEAEQVVLDFRGTEFTMNALSDW